MREDNAEVSSEARLIGVSGAMRAVEAEVDCAARSDAKVLVTGETGVGKEVVARLIHHRSARRHTPLVTINCAGVAESLLESELFGHVRGSFTGAFKDKRGLLETATNGTVFLDEIGEMSLRMQAVLLRFLQSGEIQRVGADKPHTRINVRLICATNRDLQAQIEAGAFREDFYFRLNVVSIGIPPLREHAEDIPLLATHFMADLCRQHGISIALSPEVVDLLTRYRWPGNVRELRNVLERLVARARGSVVTPADLPAQLLAAAGAAKADVRSDKAGESVVNMNGGAPDPSPARVHELAARMLVDGESFWSAVAPAFASRSLPREDLRKIVHLGLERTQGSYRNLLSLFNIPAEDNARFLNFLQENDCHLPRHGLRTTGRRSRQSAAPASEKA